jgi:hypothetical protein
MSTLQLWLEFSTCWSADDYGSWQRTSLACDRPHRYAPRVPRPCASGSGDLEAGSTCGRSLRLQGSSQPTTDILHTVFVLPRSLCALSGALVIDPDGAYDPRIVNDRLLLGLKGTMSEYELSLMRQRGIAARDSKAKRGEFRFMLPPGFCWSEAGKIEIDPDQHVSDTIRLVFTKFRELGSARQVFLWLRSADIKMPIVLRNVDVCKLVWKSPAYHSVMQILHNPLYAGAYAFGRRAQRTHIVDGRARKVSGFAKPRDEWNVLLRDNHPGYVDASIERVLENRNDIAIPGRPPLERVNVLPSDG